MSDTETARWALPLLQPGQAQKEMFHNEAIAALDLIVQAAAVAAVVDTPPGAPESGQSWIVGDSPTGAWTGNARRVAAWSEAGWRFIVPAEGMAMWVIADAQVARFTEGAWLVGEETAAHLIIDGDQVVGARQPAIADPTGGSVADAESRAALVEVLTALRTHGLIES